jgi:hypothetical protein
MRAGKCHQVGQAAGRIAAHVWSAFWHAAVRAAGRSAADQVDDYGCAVVSGGVVNPGLDVAVVLLGCPACFVERVGDAVWSYDAVGGAGERVVFLGPAGSVYAHKAEAFGVIAWIGVMDVEIDQYALGVCGDAGYLRHWRACWRRW